MEGVEAEEGKRKGFAGAMSDRLLRA